MAAKRCRSLLVWDQTSAKSRNVASTQLLLGDTEHLALSLPVKARQPDGDEFDSGVVGALEYSDTRILYNDFIAYTPVATGSGHIRDLKPRRHL